MRGRRYTAGMRSIAEQLSRDVRDAVARLSAEERIDLALRLGDEAVALYSAARGVDAVTARACLASLRQAGRRRSRAASG